MAACRWWRIIWRTISGSELWRTVGIQTADKCLAWTRAQHSAAAEMGDRLATRGVCRKAVGLLCPLWGGGELGPPSNTMWPGPRPASIPSGILIHPTVWPQYTNVTDRDRTDNGLIAFYKRSRRNPSREKFCELRQKRKRNSSSGQVVKWSWNS